MTVIIIFKGDSVVVDIECVQLAVVKRVSHKTIFYK